jgi:YegS/Rv2252/BmrU family lipid kinase
MTTKRLVAIVNPVSGADRSAVERIQAFLDSQDVFESEMRQTQEAGDATRFAQEAAQSGVDVVIASGGDGTVMEVADGLRGTSVPLAICPTGTANVMAVELGVPLEIEQALALITDPAARPRTIDMGTVDGRQFILRTSIGFEAAMTAGTARGEKSKHGRMAYFNAALRALRRVVPVRYKITLDDQRAFTRYGISCIVCNSASIGVPGLYLFEGCEVDDGLLDVVVIGQANLLTGLKLLASIILEKLKFIEKRPKPVESWKAKKITVESRARQHIAYDGELFKKAKRFTAQAIPQTVNVIVPAEAVPS